MATLRFRVDSVARYLSHSAHADLGGDFIRAESGAGSEETFLFYRYFARAVGRTWNFTTFGRVPLPPSWCQGVYIE